MNEPDPLERELRSLGDALRGMPSVAEAVLGIIASNAPESLSTESPMADRGRRQGGRRNWGDLRGRLRRRFAPRAAVVAAALVGAALAVFSLRTDSVAFAQVRGRLAAVRTASLSITHSIVQRGPNSRPKTTTIRQRLFLRADGRVRTDGPRGVITILSPGDFVRLEIDPGTRTATRRYIYEIEDKRDVITRLRTLHRSVEAAGLPAREFQGVTCPGFRVEERESTLRVWVDPRTRLPRHAERSYAKALAGDDGDVLDVSETYDDMKFDEPLADELFALAPPAGYAVTTVGTPPADRKNLFVEPLVATPKLGVGPLTFGMPRAEVVRRLGIPDAEDVVVPGITVTEETDQVDGKVRPPGASLVVLTELHTLHYDVLGLWLTVEAVEGLRGILCFGQDSLGPQGRTFRGATDRAIRIGSSRDEVIKAYGPPDKVLYRKGVLRYAPLHLEFNLTPDQTVRSIGLSDSYEHRLRFEWRMPKGRRAPDPT